MAQVRLFLPSLIATLALAAPALQAAGDDPQAQIVEDLRQLAQEARQRNAADRWLQRALDDLVARYDNPWQQPILFEDFGDGDYDFGVVAVDPETEESAMHTCLDDTAQPDSGWYLSWTL